MGDWLREHWDFGDLDASEQRFRELADSETDDDRRAEILTQLARVHGLRGDFDEGERLVREAESLGAESVAARVRIDLERGRLLRSSGDREAALPLFESAFDVAQCGGESFLAADAAHMAALAAPDREAFVAWTKRGIEVAEADANARTWLGPLLNNLGWEYQDSGEDVAALAAFERALAERERDPTNADGLRLAHYAVSKALRALGRPAEALEHAEWPVESAESEGSPDGWNHEELAEVYAALGRAHEAAEQARRALELLPDADPSFADDEERSARLRNLAASRG